MGRGPRLRRDRLMRRGEIWWVAVGPASGGEVRKNRPAVIFCEPVDVAAPDQVTETQLRRYFLHLKNEKHFAYGSIRVAFSGIKFFYSRTCKRQWETLATMKLQRAQTLPEVLTIGQVHSIIDTCRVERIALFFWTAYSLGLRLEETRNLHVGDIDSQRMMVHIHRGKGAKDRYVPIPQTTLAWLRKYWLTHRHAKLLFPAEGRDHQPLASHYQADY